MAKRKSPTNKKIPIDWKEVDKFLVSGCAGTQVADALGIHADTLYNRCKEEKKMVFTAYSARMRQKGNSYIHAKQYQTAMNGNTTMLIWLGKQRLGQSEQPKGTQEFNGSLASLLDVMHMIKSSEDFDALVQLAKNNKKAPKDE